MRLRNNLWGSNDSEAMKIELIKMHASWKLMERKRTGQRLNVLWFDEIKTNPRFVIFLTISDQSQNKIYVYHFKEDASSAKGMKIYVNSKRGWKSFLIWWISLTFEILLFFLIIIHFYFIITTFTIHFILLFQHSQLFVFNDCMPLLILDFNWRK